MDVSPPSGTQWSISHGDAHAVVVAVGGGLRSFDVGGHPVIDGYDVTAMADGARCQSLIPWPNRVQDGVWSHQGERLQLALTEPEQHNAIHGLLRWAVWSAAEHSDDAVTVTATSYPQPGYPWTLEVSNAWSIAATGVAVTTTIRNRSATAAPVACGFHPYLTAGTPTVDTSVLHLPVDTWLPTGAQQIPTGQVSVAGSPYDFREPRAIGDLALDVAFTGLARDPDGRFRLRLSGERTVTLWLDEAYPYVEVFSGDTLAPARRRQGLGVEPMSAPPNALVTGEGLVLVDPGEAWQGSWGIEAG